MESIIVLNIAESLIRNDGRAIVLPMADREQIIKLGAVIDAKRREINKLEQEVRQLEAQLDAQLGVVTSGPVHRERSLTDQVAALFFSNPHEKMTAQHVLRRLELPDDRLPTIRSTLARLVSMDVLERGEYGVYQARR
jgi:hypothetical protein